jgi:hypothetical protein
MSNLSVIGSKNLSSTSTPVTLGETFVERIRRGEPQYKAILVCELRTEELAVAARISFLSRMYAIKHLRSSSKPYFNPIALKEMEDIFLQFGVERVLWLMAKYGKVATYPDSFLRAVAEESEAIRIEFHEILANQTKYGTAWRLGGLAYRADRITHLAQLAQMVFGTIFCVISRFPDNRDIKLLAELMVDLQCSSCGELPAMTRDCLATVTAVLSGGVPPTSHPEQVDSGVRAAQNPKSFFAMQAENAKSFFAMQRAKSVSAISVPPTSQTTPVDRGVLGPLFAQLERVEWNGLPEIAELLAEVEQLDAVLRSIEAGWGTDKVERLTTSSGLIHLVDEAASQMKLAITLHQVNSQVNNSPEGEGDGLPAVKLALKGLREGVAKVHKAIGRIASHLEGGGTLDLLSNQQGLAVQFDFAALTLLRTVDREV